MFYCLCCCFITLLLVLLVEHVAAHALLVCLQARCTYAVLLTACQEQQWHAVLHVVAAVYLATAAYAHLDTQLCRLIPGAAFAVRQHLVHVTKSITAAKACLDARL